MLASAWRIRRLENELPPLASASIRE